MSKRIALLIVAAVIVIAALAAFLVLRGDPANLPGTAGIGPSPTLPEPRRTLVPTVHIAPAKGWPDGAQPTAANGLAVNAFATGLSHPRWLYVLPNGDVLVAESDGPPRPVDAKGIKAGALLVADDVGNTVWRVTPAAAKAASATSLLHRCYGAAVLISIPLRH
jgi:glucose/arabinose dehydrogenase